MLSPAWASGRGLSFLRPLIVWYGWRLPFFSLLCASTLVLGLWPRLGGPSEYNELIVGAISWNGDNKLRDYYALGLFAVAGASLFAVLQLVYVRLAAGGHGAERAVADLLDLALLPVAAWFGVALVYPGLVDFPVAWVATSATVGMLLVLSTQWAKSMSYEQLQSIGGYTFGVMFLGFFCAVGVRLVSTTFVCCLWSVPTRSVTIAAIVLPVALVVLLAVTSPSPGRFETRLRRAVSLLQFPLPLLLLSVLPGRFLEQGRPFHDPAAVGLWAAILLVAVVVWIRWWNRTRRTWTDATRVGVFHALEPASLATIAVFFSMPLPEVPTLFSDDFHLGEQILPWQQIFGLGLVPFQEFATPHGLMPVLGQLVNRTLFSGTLQHFLASANVLQAAACTATFLVAYRLAGPAIALFMLFMLPGLAFRSTLDRMVFLPLALFTLALPAIIANPRRWLTLVVPITAFVALYNPSSGAAFAAAVLPCGAWMVWRLWQNDRRELGRLSGIAAGLLIAAMLIPWSRGLLVGYVRFLLENGSTNLVANGLPFVLGLGHGNGLTAHPIAFAVLKLIWVPVALLTLVLAVRALASVSLPDRGSRTFLCAGTGVLLFTLAAWSLARVDAGISRTGAVGFLSLGLFLPAALASVVPTPRPLLFVALAMVGGLENTLFNFQWRFDARGTMQRASHETAVPANMRKVAGETVGIPQLGTLFLEPAQFDQLEEVRQALRTVLTPGSTYLDFTNRQAHYYYNDLPVPAIYSASYVAVNASQQRRMLDRLAQHPPDAVWVWPSYNPDDFTPSLRSFYLYRTFVRDYLPFRSGQLVFLVGPRSPAHAQGLLGGARKRVLTEVFAHPDLRSIPAGWGRSWWVLRDEVQPGPTLDSQLSEALAVERRADGTFVPEKASGYVEESYLFSNPDVALAIQARGFTSGLQHYDQLGRNERRVVRAPALVYNLQPFAVTGQSADLLEIDFALDTHAPLVARTILVDWQVDGQWATVPARMNVETGKLIVPLSAFPEWLLADRVTQLRISILNLRETDTFRVSGMALWRRLP